MANCSYPYFSYLLIDPSVVILQHPFLIDVSPMDQYRVFGNPIKQSRSPFIHSAFAKETKQNIVYKSEHVPFDEFETVVIAFAKSGGKGANVTVPFKEQALALCNRLSERAKLAGAVNTLSFVDGNIVGDNTDGLGLVNDLLANSVELRNSRILMIGAGGAAKGVVLPLLEQQPHSIVVTNRTEAKAKALCEQFNDSRLMSASFEQANQQQFDVIINATSAGLSGSALPISAQIINNNVACYDMVYGKSETPFIQFAKQNDAKLTIDGLGMLVGQAAESFYIWRNVKPETENVLSDIRIALMAE